MDITMKEFTSMVIEELKDRLEDVDVKTEDVIKNNGIKLHGVTIRRKGCNIAPCVHLDNLFDDYRNGNASMSKIITEIIQEYEDCLFDQSLDMSYIMDYSRICIYLEGKLVNTDMNKELLNDIPHREFLDLSIIYTLHLKMQELSGAFSVLVKKSHMELWGITEETLYLQMMENMKVRNENYIVPLSAMIHRQKGEAGQDFAESENDGPQVYVFSNKKNLNGAVEILRESSLRNFSDKMERDFILIPSSIHEWLLVPVDETFKSEDLKYFTQMVKEVNDNHVNPYELLSYHVYKYERKTGRVTIAA